LAVVDYYLINNAAVQSSAIMFTDDR